MDYTHPTDPFVQSLDIHEILPQQEPFIMIGSMQHFDMDNVVTQTTVSPGNIFVEEDKFNPSGIMENIAQTCAARIGYINKYILKRGIQTGFIGAIRSLDIMELPHSGDTITTTVCVLEEVFGMMLAHAEITCHGKTIAEGDIKIVVNQ